MSFAAIIATRIGTEGSNFHIRNTMTAIVEVSSNRLLCIVACDRATGCYGLGFLGYFCCVEKRLSGYWRKLKMFQGHFLRRENSS